MLPILPAILLLLFQSPANIQRMAQEGHWPAVFEAVQRLDQHDASIESETIAHLLAASNAPQLTQALVAILRWLDQPEAIASEPVLANRTAQTFQTSQSPPAEDGFVACRRTRDGPQIG
ncbi:hypothetical protein BH11ARM1_BH11ARM1_00470 [soil metagenome]